MNEWTIDTIIDNIKYDIKGLNAEIENNNRVIDEYSSGHKQWFINKKKNRELCIQVIYKQLEILRLHIVNRYFKIKQYISNIKGDNNE